jgi:predicted Fe-Mo cluster-binding NifX family protein
MRRVKVAVPTKSHAGLKDTVSEAFGRAETFTIVKIEDGKIKHCKTNTTKKGIKRFASILARGGIQNGNIYLTDLKYGV